MRQVYTPRVSIKDGGKRGFVPRELSATLPTKSCRQISKRHSDQKPRYFQIGSCLIAGISLAGSKAKTRRLAASPYSISVLEQGTTSAPRASSFLPLHLSRSFERVYLESLSITINVNLFRWLDIMKYEETTSVVDHQRSI